MDFLEKLDYLMAKNSLNKSSLSKSCGIPYTTIDGWYKKGYEGLKLTTLRKLSDFFKTSLDYWVEDTHPSCNKKHLSLKKADLLAELGLQYNLDTLDKVIIQGYIDLDSAQRDAIKQYLFKIVDGLLSDENYESFREGYLDSHPTQMAASNGDTSGLEEIIAQFEAADNIYLDSKKDKKK